MRRAKSFGGDPPGKLREIEPATFARADRVVVDSLVQVEKECGDVLETRAQCLWERSKVHKLTAIVSGTPAHEWVYQITLLKSVGTGSKMSWSVSRFMK